MKYTISEMAKLLGVTTHMLRYYEKIGIIRPETNQQTGYRYYSVIDTRRFNLSRSLFSTGFTLEQCAEIITDIAPEGRDELFDRQIAVNRRQMELSKIAVRYLETTKRIYDSLERQTDRITVENQPRQWRLNLSKNECPNKDEALEAEKEEWLSCLPAASWVSRIPQAVLKQFSTGVIDYEYGLMIQEKDALVLGLRRTQNVEIVPGGDYLVTIHRKVDRSPW
ncbi:MAG: MerR family transcriptional regulator, partial [Clostridia bacterium]|nr:MerR family transcriptional regulator [Clostridia bacterium]